MIGKAQKLYPRMPSSICRVFPGLWLAVAQLLTRNMQRVLAVLQEGLQSPEHAAFVQKLADD